MLDGLLTAGSTGLSFGFWRVGDPQYLALYLSLRLANLPRQANPRTDGLASHVPGKEAATKSLFYMMLIYWMRCSCVLCVAGLIKRSH